MIIPPQLKPGDTIGITAPGRKIPKADLKAAIDIVKSWGLNVQLAKNLFSDKHSYLAGTDEERLSDFQSLINDANVKAILCARGGYGSTRIVDQIDFSPLLVQPKYIIGFSDITAIHLKLYSLDIQSIHATMPVLFAREKSASSVESLRQMLLETSNKFISSESIYSRPGTGAGKIIGGNLSLIVDSLGTSSDPDMDGCILVIEEVDEYRYKLDRMITQLWRAGKLNKLAGLIVGYMTDIKDSELGFGETAEEIVLNHVNKYTYPIAFDFPTGHENPNLAWKHGGTGNLHVANGRATLTFVD
ncbi:MAG TPA: LD-carboxypeptidase [Ohtaekwangia sp.]|uniref:S66 peptidase family protein n=1 Tax=Ohtaekwangia sp. TaxID=2066019 RepID=UPI002F94D9BE